MRARVEDHRLSDSLKPIMCLWGPMVVKISASIAKTESADLSPGTFGYLRIVVSSRTPM